MTVTVAGVGLDVIDACENVTYNDAAGTDSDLFKEGSNSVYAKLRASGANDVTFTPPTAVNMTTNTVLRFWGMFGHGSFMDLAPTGLQIGISDGVNTGWYDLGGRDTYSGGWYNFVVDVSLAVDSGTKPTSMNAITVIYVRINVTGTPKNVDNTWVDNLALCDGLSAYGDDGGGYFDFDNIFLADENPTLGLGVVRKIGGVYFATGEFEIGDSAGVNACKFQAKNQSLVFEDRDVRAALYNITVVDNGTGTTEFLLGEKSGTAGISGCTIQVEDASQAAKVDVVATDTDITNFGIYGSTLIGLDDILLPATSTITDVLNTNFSGCGTVVVDTCTIRNCNFINALSNAIEIDSLSHDVEDCTFIVPTTSGIEISAAPTGNYQFDGLEFVGTTVTGPYDVNNTSGSAITIDVNSGNAQYSTGSAVTFIISPATIIVLVKDVVSGLELVGARVIVTVNSAINFPFEASVTISRVGAVATVSHTGHGMEVGDKVFIDGAEQWEYNGVKTITGITTGTYTFAVVGTPTTPATGTITSTMVIIDEITNTGGIANDTRSYSNDQPFVGRVREATNAYYKQTILQGTIDKASGYSTIVQLIPDE